MSLASVELQRENWVKLAFLSISFNIIVQYGKKGLEGLFNVEQIQHQKKKKKTQKYFNFSTAYLMMNFRGATISDQNAANSTFI